MGLTRSLAVDLAPSGIRAVHVAPGAIAAGASFDANNLADRADRTLQRNAPAGRWGTPEQGAAIVASLCTNDAADVTSSSIIVDGGLLAY